MKFKNILFVCCLLLYASGAVQAQGPPITSDKPIMLGSKAIIVKTLTEIRNTDYGTYTRVPVMFHYLPTSHSLVALHVPIVASNFNALNHFQGNFPGIDLTQESINDLENYEYETSLGDIGLMMKYQWFRRDMKGKTFRVVAKSYQSFPTGERTLGSDINLGSYQGYYGMVAGYETIKHGISLEVGYNNVPELDEDAIRVNMGFGLPLLKPLYPVNQLNLYFEYNMVAHTQKDVFELLYAQGVQYARNQWTWEVAVQAPLVQSGNDLLNKRNYSLFLGTRFIL